MQDNVVGYKKKSSQTVYVSEFRVSYNDSRKL